MNAADFQFAVFAGGGHRCWWQAGWWHVVAPATGIAPREIAAVSAGAATACLIYANDAQRALDYYDEILGGDDARNMYWQQWRNGRAAIFPHERIYRGALATLLGGEHFEQLKSQAPLIRVAFARPPSGWPLPAAVLLGLVAYNTEKYLRRPLHPTMGPRLGFASEVATVQDCTSEQELIDLIIQSSCTPPFTAVQRRSGQPVLDGGLFDNVPVRALTQFNGHIADGADDDPDTLVLVTRRYPDKQPVFQVGRRVYVQPSRKVPASSWDYTSPDDYRATYQQGREDAELFLRWLENEAVQ